MMRLWTHYIFFFSLFSLLFGHMQVPACCPEFLVQPHCLFSGSLLWRKHLFFRFLHGWPPFFSSHLEYTFLSGTKGRPPSSAIHRGSSHFLHKSLYISLNVYLSQMSVRTITVSISYPSHYNVEILDKSSLWKEGLILAHSFRESPQWRLLVTWQTQSLPQRIDLCV